MVDLHALTRAEIARMGRRGEGVAEIGQSPVYVPYAVPGDTVDIEPQGERGRLIRVADPSRDRIDPVCPHFTVCGGCAVQAWAHAPYAAWKRGLLVDALARAGLQAEIAPLVDAHGGGRRRATFHARAEPSGTVRVGFMRARAHDVVDIDRCPVLDPALAGALPAARAVSEALARLARRRAGFSLDIVATATASGLDIDLRGQGPLDEREHARLCDIAAAHDLARLSNHGTIVLERRKPCLRMGQARLEPPPGAFLQATSAGEAELAAQVMNAAAGSKRIADLFCGIGTFAVRVAAEAEVAAYDSEAPALAALDRAARATPGLRPIRIEVRDLFRRPLDADELKGFDAVVLDPPRAGAEAQMRAIAASSITRVISVACDVQSFARDAAILTSAGFTIDRVVPVDQFRYSAHLEMVAAFRRPPMKRRRLLG